MKRFIVVSVLLLASMYASADVLTTLNFSGSIYSIYDGAGLFGTAGTSYNSGTYTGTITYDPTTFGACNNAPSGCTWNLQPSNNFVETFTFNGKTASFIVTAGQLQFQTGGGNSDQITLTPSGSGFTLGVQFGDGSSFFGNPPNLSPALNFGNVNLAYGGGYSSGNAPSSTSINFSVTKLSATTTTVPEPSSLALLGIGLVGLGRRIAHRRLE